MLSSAHREPQTCAGQPGGVVTSRVLVLTEKCRRTTHAGFCRQNDNVSRISFLLIMYLNVNIWEIWGYIQ